MGSKPFALHVKRISSLFPDKHNCDGHFGLVDAKQDLIPSEQPELPVRHRIGP